MPTTNWVSKFTSFFLQRKQAAIVLALLLTVAGTVGLLSLRREGFPQVPVKIVVINTIYRGAASAEIEQSVTNPIESVIKDLKAVKSVASTSSESVSSIVVTLNEDANVDTGLQDITSKVSGVQLPKDADKPNVIQPSTGGSSFVFGLTGDVPSGQLLEQGRIFEREISSVKGIKRVELASTYTDRIVVTFDPVKVAASGVDVSKISGTLAANNLNFPAGRDLAIDGSRATLTVAGNYNSLEDLRSTNLPAAGGRTVSLGEVATIDREIDQDGSINSIGLLRDGRPQAFPGIVYNVDIRADADILNVDGKLEEAIKRLETNNIISPKLTITRLVDSAESTNEQIKEIEAGAIGEKWDFLGPVSFIGYLFGGIWLLMLAMLLFVNVRTALIAGLAIPFSFLFTVAVLWSAGITLNTLTLFSMVLVLGLVVDPAIVVLESIQRYKDMGKSRAEGAIAAVNSIGKGLFIATLCSIIVFTPFGIVSGVFGEIIKYIPITVIPALVASFFVPLIFLAPLAGRFMNSKRSPQGQTAPDQGNDEEVALWAVSRWFKRANLFILRHASLQIIIILLAVTLPIGITAYLFVTGQVKSAQFSKPKDTLQALVSVSYPAGFTDQQIKEIAINTQDVLSKRDEIKSYYYLSQSSTGFSIYLSFTPLADRDSTADSIVAYLKTKLPNDPSRQVYSTAGTLSAGPPENDFPVQLQIYDNDLEKLKKFALAVAQHARTLEGVNRVSDGYTDGGTNAIRINLNKEVTAAKGLNVAAVGGQLGGLLGEQNLTKLSLGDEQIDVIGRYRGADQFSTVAALRNAVIGTPTGPVRLGEIAAITTDPAAGSISHQDGQRFATVKAGVNASTSPFETQDQLNSWAKDRLGEYGLRADALESKGEGDDIAQSFINLFQALGIAILMVYLVLALFFGSFLKPIIITFSLPLSFLGVFPTLAILGNEFGFLEILGLITLAGLVVNVGIFVIDYANHKVAEGMPVNEAIAQATAVRFRPIFLTKVTALGSLLPLAILSPFWRGLASVIIAGIVVSGVLSLFTTPILYVWFERLSHLPTRLKYKFRHRTNSGQVKMSTTSNQALTSYPAPHHTRPDMDIRPAQGQTHRK